MATMQGITGKLSGKMGSAVFRVREGQQVVTQYNPIVKNPNTKGQQTQRAAFKLMAQLAAIMSPGFGTLSVAKRKAKGGTPSQRNAFTQVNFPLVSTTEVEGSVVAKIPMEQLKLTSSTRPLGEVNADRSGNTIEVSVATASSDIKSVRMILVGYPKYSGEAQPAITSIVDVPVVSGEAAHTFDGLGNSNYTILSYGLIPIENASLKTRLDNIHTPDDEEFIGALELNQLVSEGSMAETVTMGVNSEVGA